MLRVTKDYTMEKFPNRLPENDFTNELNNIQDDFIGRCPHVNWFSKIFIGENIDKIKNLKDGELITISHCDIRKDGDILIGSMIFRSLEECLKMDGGSVDEKVAEIKEIFKINNNYLCIKDKNSTYGLLFRDSYRMIRMLWVYFETISMDEISKYIKLW